MITVVLTTYNRCHLLPRAVQSVLDGDYDNFELLIIDDASSDDTPSVVSKLNDPRIRYLRQPENGGVLRARNRGFDAARGDYVVLLDDDDELVPTALSSVVKDAQAAALQGVDILWFDCVDAESRQLSGYVPTPNGIIEFDDYVCGRIHGDFWLVFGKEALDGHRFDETLRAHESLLWLRIHRTRRARHIAKTVCRKYRNHGGERLCDMNVRVRQMAQTTLAMTHFIREFGGDLARLCPSSLGARLAYLGLHQMAINEFVAGRRSLARSFKYRRSLKYALMYPLSFFLSAAQVSALIARMEP